MTKEIFVQPYCRICCQQNHSCLSLAEVPKNRSKLFVLKIDTDRSIRALSLKFKPFLFPGKEGDGTTEGEGVAQPKTQETTRGRGRAHTLPEAGVVQGRDQGHQGPPRTLPGPAANSACFLLTQAFFDVFPQLSPTQVGITLSFSKKTLNFSEKS